MLREENKAEPVSPLVESITVSGGDDRETTSHAQEQVNSVKVWKGKREYYSAAERSVVDDGESMIAAALEPESYFDKPVVEERRESPKPPPTTPRIKSRIKTPHTHSRNHGSWRMNVIGELYRPSSHHESPPSSNEQSCSLPPAYRPKTLPMPLPQRPDMSSSSVVHAPRILNSVSPRRPVSPMVDRKTTAERSTSRTPHLPSPQGIPLPSSRSSAFRIETLSKPQQPRLRSPSPAPISPT